MEFEGGESISEESKHSESHKPENSIRDDILIEEDINLDFANADLQSPIATPVTVLHSRVAEPIQSNPNYPG